MLKAYLGLRRKLRFISLGLLFFAMLALPLAVIAESNTYETDQSLQRGMVVTQDGPGKVRAANNLTVDEWIGVVTEIGDPPSSLSGEKLKVVIGNKNPYSVLVSDESGVIDAGDYVTLSSIPGVGMKASTEHDRIVGQALDKFDGQKGVVQSTEISQGGSQKQVKLGYANVWVEPVTNPLVEQAKLSDLPTYLKKLSTKVAQKPVSSIRAYIALLLLAITVIVTVTMLYTGVRATMIAIGRNPLAKSTIVQQLLRVVLVSVGIFISGVLGVYLLLKL